MQDLSNGYKKPANGERGSQWFPALEHNIQRLNDHTHDGNDSELLSPVAITSTKQTISSGSWVSVGGGLYRQLVTMPGTLTRATVAMSFRFGASDGDGDPFYPTIVASAANTYYIYINDNSVSCTAIYR